MRKLAQSVLFFALATTAATAQTRPGTLQTIHHEDADTAPLAQMLTSLPFGMWPVSAWYKQDVYDQADNKIGQILDVLVDHGGKNFAIIIGVGGFLGIGEKDVAVPFDAVHFKEKDNHWQAVINTTKETLRDARGYKYDRNALNWIPENASGTTGSPSQK